MKKLLLGLGLILLTAVNSHAMLFGGFPGLEPLVASADAIVVLRIEACINQNQEGEESTYRCLIFQTLKGDLPREKEVVLQLFDPEFHMMSPLNPGSTHLVFLVKKRSPDESADYRALERVGAVLTLSPFANEKMPEGKTVVEQVQTLVRRAKDYWNDQQTKENALMDGILGAPAAAPPPVAASPDGMLTKQISDLLLDCSILKPGMTRADLLKVFDTEGGLFTANGRTYVHRRCSCLKVDVEFAHAVPNQGALEELPTDIITKISKPYLDWSISD
jgi:hypothetical protein